uniref:VTT domain-containing protein n=1 Tax=Chromera velia CCMP2878 TaxID=1169474 RepID=A0A0K6SAX4_9ALVE|eukprot:Cvel_11782.t1-p1 / transcript=Cvel_11782.t1 / gene=Cvel_11782 / organism=Chromera_velia_CCMP2878 / gene_product=TVP38/TMEM64 family membrane protein slr0305, putative / transcript_product=TVP38/TMEM64 family membrane protein slr0305, putative / location=Cvel_scaffold749:47494-52229(+) / protein_length=379 / sequence_SO=supercontig / SO=protein_coding / is_pseudo=false
MSPPRTRRGAAAAALAIASRAYASDGFDLDIFRSFSTSATASLVDPSVSLLSESPSLSLSFLETAVLAVVADAQASLSAAEEAVSQVSQEEMQNLQEASEAASEAYKSARMSLPSITDQGLNPALFLEQSVQRVQDMGTMGFAYFVLVYVIAEVLCVPALPLTASAGYLFGVTEGTLTVLLAGTAACAISFLLARTILRPRLQTMFADNPRFRAVDRVVQKESFKVILILRLSPLLPFGISNYLYGLTSVEFIPYILASVVGFIPGTLGYVYSGQLSHQVLSTGTNSEQNSVSWLTAGLILVSVFALSKLITEKASEALKEIEEEEEATAERERAQAALEAQGMLKGGGGGGGEGEMRLRSRPFDLEEEGEITEESTLG